MHSSEPFAGRLQLPVRDVAPLFSFAERLDAARPAIEAAGLARGGAEGPSDRLVALADYFRVMRACAAAALEESLGLTLRPLVSGTTDFVMAQAAGGGELEGALRRMALAYNKLHGGEYNFVERNDGALVYRVDDAAFPYTRPQDASITLVLECILIYLHGAVCSIVGEDVTPAVRRIWTRRPERATHDPLAFWSCPVECAAPYYAIVYAPELAAKAIVRSRLTEDGIHKRILGLIEARESEFAALFTMRVRQALREGVRDQEEAGRRLGVSVATLRRKLGKEGASFRALRQEFLNETAKLSLLSAPRIADVADDLGFSDPRSFTRAFKAWNGRSPKAYRTGQ